MSLARHYSFSEIFYQASLDLCLLISLNNKSIKQGCNNEIKMKIFQYYIKLMKNYKCKEIYKINLRQPKAFIYLIISLVTGVEESNSFLEMSRDLLLTVDCDHSEQSRGEGEERDVSRRTVSLRLRHSQSRTSLGCGLVMCIWVT